MATTMKTAARGAAAEVKRYPIYLAGEWATSDKPLEIVNPYDGSVVGVTYDATQEQLERAIVAAQQAFETTRNMPTFDRAALLEALARGLKARRDEIIRMIALEAGKPVRDADVRSRPRRLYTANRRRRSEADRRRSDSARSAAVIERPLRHRPPLPDRADRRHLALQLPAQPRLAQARPGDRVRQPIVLKPPSRDPLTMLLFAEIARRNGRAEGCRQHLADVPRGRRRASSRMTASNCCRSPARPMSAGR